MQVCLAGLDGVVISTQLDEHTGSQRVRALKRIVGQRHGKRIGEVFQEARVCWAPSQTRTVGAVTQLNEV